VRLARLAAGTVADATPKVKQAVLHPDAVDLIELATRTEPLDLQIEETWSGPAVPWPDRPLAGSPGGG
jgi:hypothetical protein